MARREWGECLDSASKARAENEKTDGRNVASKDRANKRPSQGEGVGRIQGHVKRGDQRARISDCECE